MNERIKELHDEAVIYTVGLCGQEHPDGPRSFQEVLDEKFAELIVRECIGCCEQVISDPVPESVDTWLNGGEQCIQEIKEHFGVKE